MDSSSQPPDRPIESPDKVRSDQAAADVPADERSSTDRPFEEQPPEERPRPSDSEISATMPPEHSPQDFVRHFSPSNSSPSNSSSTPPAITDEPPTVISNKADLSDTPHPSSSSRPLSLGRDLVGQTLGHFQLDAFVGAGGMGAVFRGHDTLLDRRVAVKVLSQEHNAKGDTVRRFRNEAQSAARLDHPNIARVYFVGEDNGWNYIVFEFIDGVNVRDLVDLEGPLSVEASLSYIVQVAEALQHASEREVVHRDIKPSNILIDYDKRAKLVDMGLARLHQVDSANSDLTASGMTLGTFDYISPEQARDPRLADVRSDLYSLGCTLFFMLTGRPPFPEGTVLQKLLSHSGEEAPDPREFRPEIPEEVVGIIQQLMAKSPADRYQMPSELIGAVLLVIEELGLTVPRISGTVWVAPSQPRTSPIERHLPWAVPLLTLLVVVFVLDTVWSARDNSWIPDPEYAAYSGTGQSGRIAESDSLVESPDVSQPAAEGRVVPIPIPESSGSSDTRGPRESIADRPMNDLPPRGSDAADRGTSDRPTNDRPTNDRQTNGSGTAERSTNSQGTNGASRDMNGSGASSTAGGTADEMADTADTTMSRESPSRLTPMRPSEMAVEPSRSGRPRIDPATVPTNVIVVPHQSETLHEAMARASTDATIDTIELRYDGPRYAGPLSFQGSPLTIKAGSGYRPTLAFAPQENDPVEWMMSISGASVTFENIDLWMDIPRDTRNHWTLFTLERAERLNLRNCVITVRQSGGLIARTGSEGTRFEPAGLEGDTIAKTNGPRGTMFHLPPRSALTDEFSIPVVPRTIGISLDNCVARGEAHLLRTGGDIPFRLQCQTSLVAVAGNLLEMRGEYPERGGTGIGATLDISRSTIDAQQGLAYLSGQGLISLRISLNESIMAWSSGEAMLTQRSDTETVDTMMKSIRFSGDGNCYELSDARRPLWRVEQRDEMGDRVEMDYLRWAKRWDEILDVSDALWENPLAASKPHSSRIPSDYALLDDSFTNPAVRPNERNAGADPAVLPRAESLMPTASPLLPQIP